MSQDNPVMAESTPAAVGGAPEVGANLRGHMSTADLIFTVLAVAAPLAVVSGVFPLVIAFSGGWSILAYAVTIVLLILFALSMASMAKYLPRPGAFYAFVTAGLGKRFGLGGGFLSLFAYWLVTTSTYAFLGSALQRLVIAFGGPDIPWFVYAYAGLGLVMALTYLNIQLSAKVMSVVMTLEVILVLIANFAVGVQADLSVLAPARLFADPGLLTTFPLAMIFVILGFIGFESTAIFREEARDPDRTIPRAMVLAVVLIGVFYLFSILMVLAAFGPEEALNLSLTDPAALFDGLVETYLGAIAVQVLAVLLTTSVLAAMIALQNMLVRYVYSFARDGLLPASMARVHKKHGSPHVSAIVTGIWVGLLTVVFFVSPGDPMFLYGQMSGAGTWTLLVLMTLVSAAVMVHFIRTPIAGASIFNTRVAPVLSTLGLGFVLVYAVTEMSLLTGLEGAWAIVFILVVLAVLVAGILLATRLRTKRPDIFRKIGRQEG